MGQSRVVAGSKKGNFQMEIGEFYVMRKALAVLKNLFWPSANIVRRRREGFLVLVVEDEARRLELEKRGRRDGVREVPETNESRLSLPESQVIELGRDFLQQNYQHYNQEFQSYNSRLDGLTPQGMLSAAKLETKGLLDAIANVPRRHKVRLMELGDKTNQAKKELKVFRHDNRLEDRSAEYPDSVILHMSFIIVLVLVESVLNANFLALGNEHGLLGGWIEAFIISLINALAIGWVLCQGIRCLHHCSVFRKLFGMVTTMLAAVSAIGFNLGVAHYRNALGGELPEKASIMAWESLRNVPWDIGDIKSMMLFSLGIVVVVLAVVDWIHMDDPYPGYGRIDRKHAEALEEWNASRDGLINVELQGLKENAERIISKYLSMAERVSSERETILRQMAALNDRLVSSKENIEDGVNRLLQIYRDANKASRDTKPPEFFRNDWCHGREVTTHAIPEEVTDAPPIEVDSVLEPLQKELHRSYEESLNALNRKDR